MNETDKLMKRGEADLSSTELVRLRSLAEAAEMYDDMHDPLPLNKRIPH
jgi:hypothetical protein